MPHGIILPEPELPTEATPPLPGHVLHSKSRSSYGHSNSLSNDIIEEDVADVKDDEEAEVLLAEGGDKLSVPPASASLPKAHLSGGRG